MEFAITVEETKSKTFIVEADSLDEALDTIEYNINMIELNGAECERKASPSYYAYVGGFATPEQIATCEHYE